MRACLQVGDDVLAEDVEERLLLLADVVDPDAVEAEADQLGQAVAVPRRIGRHEHRSAHVRRADEAGGLVEVLGQLQVPAHRWGEHVAAPLIVGDRQASSSVAAQHTCAWR